MNVRVSLGEWVDVSCCCCCCCGGGNSSLLEGDVEPDAGFRRDDRLRDIVVALPVACDVLVRGSRENVA